MRKQKVIWGLLLAAALCMVIYSIFNYAINAADLTEVTGTLEAPITFDDESKNKGIRLKLRENGVLYKTGGAGYDQFRRVEAKRNLGAGSVITIQADEKNRFYSLKSGSDYYLRLENYNREKKDRRWVLLIMWFAAFGFYVYALWFRKRNPSSISRENK